MSEPHLMYAAHTMRRRIICHVGPTNSGKTHAALQALMSSKSGVYCGPLRLLAWEVSESLRSKNVPCDLVTGQERDKMEGSNFVACTIEMLDTSVQYEAGIIDECQLIGDFSRGWAWTKALLGMQARVIHLCGSPSMQDIVRKLSIRMGTEMEVITYNRLSPLNVGEKALKNYKNIRKGDCVIGFSRKVLYDIKRQIEAANRDLRCCIIYGNLPPAARKEQARLFNEENSGYDVLVASDAIGMGLNLNIQRIVFSALDKFDGRQRRALLHSEIKQIGGRAGRYASQFSVGEVITYQESDMTYLRKAINAGDVHIKKAGLWPSREQLELLGILRDLDVTEEVLTNFWTLVMQAEFDSFSDDYRIQERVDTRNLLTIGHILRHFPSTEDFANKLSAFMYENNLLKRTYEYDVSRGPRTCLSTLYRLFRKRAETENNYFVCNLEEAATIADAIGAVDLTFNDRIVFCSSPVSVDNEDVMDAFFSFCQDFATQGSVEYVTGAPRSVSSPKRGPSSIEALFELETKHKILDLYVWLGLHFPIQFKNVENVSRLAFETSLLIHEGIQSIGSKAYMDALADRRHQKDKKKKGADRAKKKNLWKTFE